MLTKFQDLEHFGYGDLRLGILRLYPKGSNEGRTPRLNTDDRAEGAVIPSLWWSCREEKITAFLSAPAGLVPVSSLCVLEQYGLHYNHCGCFLNDRIWPQTCRHRPRGYKRGVLHASLRWCWSYWLIDQILTVFLSLWVHIFATFMLQFALFCLKCHL